MKSKIFLFLGLFLILVSGIFGFEILNSQGESQEYFSLTDNFIKVVSDVQVDNVSIEYEILGVTKITNYPFFSCNEGYCSSFDLSSLTESSGGSFSNSNIFNITVLNKSKLVFIDLENPFMNLSKFELNSSTQEVEFEFSVGDNSNKIKSVKLYRKLENSEIFVENLLNLSIYNYKILNSGEYIFLFKVEDEAGNSKEFEYNLTVGDIFKPIINSVFVVVEDSNYDIEFTISDNQNLSKYEIVQGNLVLTEDIIGNSFNKIISVPFNSGNILFKIYDFNGNVFEKNISLNSIISNTFYDKFSDKKEFRFKSNSDECFLIKINSKSYNSKFSENSDIFSYDLDINGVGNYNLEFYCVKDNFKEYYSKEFYYDVNKPSNFDLSSFVNDEGSVSLEWTESFDNEGIVEYRVFRDDNEIYEGSKLKFKDKSAVYPETYSYFIEAFDEAGNKVQTSVREVTPKKIKVTFDTNLIDSKTVENSEFNFEIKTDKNSNVTISLKSAGEIIDSKIYKNIQEEKLNCKFNLESGINQIIIEIVDEVGNSFEETYFITYDDSLVKSSIEEVETETVVTPVVEEPETIIEPKTEQIGEKESTNNIYSWFWFVVIIIIFLIFIKIFIFDEDKLTFLKKRKKIKSKKLPLLSVERVKDHNLEKDFDRIKKERIRKQFNIKKEFERKKNLDKRGLTKFEKQKLADLANNRHVKIPFNNKSVVKKKIKKVNNEVIYEENLKPSKVEIKSSINKFFSRESKVEKEDDFTRYLQKVKSSPSWNSTKDYMFKPVVIEPVVEKKSQVENNNNTSSLENISTKNKNFSFFKRKEKERIETVSEELDNNISKDKFNLDAYLNKRIKNNKKRFYFAEKSVERDLKNRDR